MHISIGLIYTSCIYIILLILFYNVENGSTQLSPYFQFLPQNDILHVKTYDYSEGFSENRFTYELQYPIPIYETLVKKITIYKNGLLALDNISEANLPASYPINTSITNQRLQDFDGRYLSVFSSVNDAQSGRIRVTEIDLLSPSVLPCIERKQIDRLVKFIHLSYIEEAELKAQYIVHILWENMTNAYLINEKANTYGMIIISNGIHSYAFMQYIQIEWNENDVAENLALPPESGIFMRPFGGYQLPRSSHAVEPNIWSTETNIALHGEWLVPLYKSESIGKINVNNLNIVANEFIVSLKTVCNYSLPQLNSNNSARSDTVVIRDVDIENTSKELHARTQIFRRALENAENYDFNISNDDYNYEMTEKAPKAAWSILQDESESSGVDLLHRNEVNVESENETENGIYDKSNQFDADNIGYISTEAITTQTYYPLGQYDGDEKRKEVHEPVIVPVTINPLYDDDNEGYLVRNKDENKYVNETSSDNLEKCDAVTECSSHNTECYRVDNAACCVCSDGFFGAGNTKCWSEVNDHKFSFSGSLSSRFGSEYIRSPMIIYLDIQHGSLRRSSSGIRGGQTHDKIYSTIRVITPVFHVLNAMISSPCENVQRNERVYNLFTLGNGLQRPFKIIFQFEVERVGKFTVQAKLELHDFTTGAYANGAVELEVFSTEKLNLLDRTYIEAYSASDKPDKTYYANYKVNSNNRIVFPEQTVKFIAETRDSSGISSFPEEINVHWSAVAETESCLLKQASSVPKNKWYYIRLKDRGYCSEDCSAPDGTCNLFCVDEPLLLATEPSPCDCVTCDRHGEVCRPEGTSYRCECGQGLKLMPDNTCQVTSYLGVQCGSVNCHKHARCIDPNQAFCQCLPGYRGDGVSHCESDSLNLLLVNHF
ncbi:egf-like domain protein [Schistosoma japonicum]|nr:egf-like domain protein [Schistosoma japonicum]